MNLIKVRGARQHNLKNIDVDIPRNQLVVITGLSGSGKSTLAFDTLYAEGQRRYVESISTYARQFLERLEKPDADLIEGLSPAIAIEQKTANHNPRSTVGTVTEIYDYLRLLFARAGTAYCPQCGEPILSQSIDQIVDRIMECPPGTRLIVLAPVVSKGRGSQAVFINRLRRDGFSRVRLNGTFLDIEQIGPLSKTKEHTLEVVVDRLVLKTDIANRLTDSLELALSLSNGKVSAFFPEAEEKGQPVLMSFSEKPTCPSCAATVPDLTPAGFSFNNPLGACKSCDGLGVRTVFDPELIVSNPDLSIKDGAIGPWADRNSPLFSAFLEAFCEAYEADLQTPFRDLPQAFKSALFHGSGAKTIRFSPDRQTGGHLYDKPFEGLLSILERRYAKSESRRDELRPYMAQQPCADCGGARLRPESRAVRVGGIGIHQIAAMTIDKTLLFFRRLELGGQKALIADKITHEIIQRLEFLKDVGLGYLTLDRTAHTLSGGESQRIRLATQIGAKLTGVLYVLDEPSIGLHQRDNRKLLNALLRMRDLGNTVLVVEHDQETIEVAEYVIDMGPGAGQQGGKIVFAGPPQGLSSAPESLTGQYLSGRLHVPVPGQRRNTRGAAIRIQGACRNNLKNIDVDFPLGCLTCVTGVSCSGKSSLVIESLLPALTRKREDGRSVSGICAAIQGLEGVDKVINIDQSPIGRTPRSNPGTYSGVFNLIRDLFSKTTDARAKGYKANRFSFNLKGGRCEACRGDGIVCIEMQFLPDLYVPCDVCGGKRYNRETLEVRYKGRNISEVLSMTVQQALTFFSNYPAIKERLQTLEEVGLGYIQLGQSATTLSGGEAQRLRIARELSRKGTGQTLYILDEPTTGLHIDDINRLLHVLNRLVDAGNTVIVIEHNLDVIKTADHLIDLGPEGGDAGGYVIGTGTPEEIAVLANSYTGQYLAPLLAGKKVFRDAPHGRTG